MPTERVDRVWRILRWSLQVCVVIVLIALFATGRIGNMTIGFPGEGAPQITVSRNPTLSELLTAIRAEPQAWEAFEVSLRTELGYYHFSDASLARKLASSFPSPPREYDDHEGRARHFAELLEEQPLVRELRMLADRSMPPFQRIGEVVRIGVPGETRHQPPPGRANVPFGSPFDGRRVKVLTTDGERFLVLDAYGAYTDVGTVELQLNRDQAVYLFTKISGKTIDATVFVVPLGEEIFDPSTQDRSSEITGSAQTS